MTVVPLAVADLRAFAERTGKDPAPPQHPPGLPVRTGRQVGRPLAPERNAPCWCGSDRKYKKCCGRPGFRDEPILDRARAILRVDPTDPQASAGPHIAAPSRIRLDRLHALITEAIAGDAGHPYGQPSPGPRRPELLNPVAGRPGPATPPCPGTASVP